MPRMTLAAARAELDALRASYDTLATVHAQTRRDLEAMRQAAKNGDDPRLVQVLAELREVTKERDALLVAQRPSRQKPEPREVVYWDEFETRRDALEYAKAHHVVLKQRPTETHRGQH